MNRIVRLLFHNWPLKLAAIVLATMLYAGLVVSQSAQEYPGTLTVRILNQKSDAILTQDLPQVTKVRYVAISDPTARAVPDSFRATVDLKDVNSAAGLSYVPIRVESVDPRFTVLSWEPPGVQIRLDPLKNKVVKVDIVTGPTPAKLEVRPAVVTPTSATVRGPASVIDRVTSVRGDVVIEPSGLNIDRDVDLYPVDDLGNRVTPVNVEPSTAHVQIAVFSEPQTHSVAVNPNVTGTPAEGFEVGAVTVDPAVVTLRLDANQVAALAAADTAPISISGATQTIEKDVDLALPTGILPLVPTTVHVTVNIRPVAGTRTFNAGIVLSGRRADLFYSASAYQVIAIAGGPRADLDRIDAATFILTAPVGGLGPGTYEVSLEANLPIGLAMVSIDPPKVTVTISVPPSVAPSAGP